MNQSRSTIASVGQDGCEEGFASQAEHSDNEFKKELSKAMGTLGSPRTSLDSVIGPFRASTSRWIAHSHRRSQVPSRPRARGQQPTADR